MSDSTQQHSLEDILGRVEEVAESLSSAAAEAEQLGRLPDRTVADLRHIGVVKMLQARRWGGYESDPVDFAQVVMRIGQLNSAAGWVAGVVGVHPWQASGFTEQLQEEIWGKDPDTWISSPYAPLGVLEPVEGGYRIAGRIPFSSGGEACEWAIVAGLLRGEDGSMSMRHLVLPRDDYWFDQDSWDVMGLRGTGSKDLVVDGTFVPDHRVYDPFDFDHGQTFEAVGLTSPMYRIPFPTIFSFAINAASQGVAEGAMMQVLENSRARVDARGIKTVEDPYQLTIISQCATDVRAGRTVLLEDGRRLLAAVQDGLVDDQLRIEVRANGVRAIRRSVEAVETAFNYAGARSLKMANPVNRGLRDAKTTLAHICNNQHPIDQVWGRVEMGLDYSLGDAFW